ncbi:hypothetical protein D9M68_894540 [compost metagenome]
MAWTASGLASTCAGVLTFCGLSAASAYLGFLVSSACSVPRICAIAIPPDDGGGMPQIFQRL